MSTDKISGLRIFTFIYGFARPYLFPLIVGTLLYCSQMVMFPLMNSVLLGGVTSAMQHGVATELLATTLQVLVLAILAMIMAFFGVLLYVAYSEKTLRRLQVGVLRSFIRTGAENSTHSGERLSMLNTDVMAAHDIYCNALATLLFSLLPMIVLSIAIFSMEWRIGLFTIFVGIFSTFGQMLFAKPLAKIAKETLETTAEATKTLGDIFSGGVIARVFNLQGRLLSAFGLSNDRLRRIVNREAKIDGAQKLVSGVSELLTTGGVFVVGSILISRGGMTLTALMTLVPLCASLTFAIAGFGSAWAGMQAPLEAGRRIYALLEGDNRVDPLPANAPPAVPEAGKGSAIDVKNLTYTYHGADKPVLKDVNISIGENQLAAFVGESGSGKSTLLKVIAGLYRCDGASVAVAGRVLSYDDIREWRSNFAYVDQSCTLFNLTIAENIGLGREGASFEMIKAAAVEADADGFITALPQGYDTPAGEVGGKLSGGQRQRIAFARALIRRSPVLILDEATSALDAESEREVVETINHLRKNHTIMMITHNLPAIKPDLTFSLENGAIAVL